ncbi:MULTISPECIES: lytic transglycosylase domain-containing protein [unclassified Cryobacterium]|uniref:aggregation-promoting factor C-terminal-like domain-containing protein n=1 Tax=unclassified Cryobacterium TaxID=2649013 RepID=UPI002AB588C1|nr:MULTISPECIES: lytic transglycosylase domain-containing protein [unclassified Cryobacterium]MDY7556147.1 lytic transglycosylase domain-containing protein [Cryobacterium sp. 10C3]MEB0002091.1 lytic transglycosylase domain-containing protein [Cryobacterium sp. RTC2.1]MEB0200487.1 lytic transglycosylase domain-containing protein [Cryobacterium sp. 5I3]MEB0290058.1 lytic transglycosylase domain-containing protein [Cryobacterium sp. 10C2]
MGRHLSVIESGNTTTPTIRRAEKPRPRARVLFLFAFTAAAAFVLVTVVDPYSGATASPYYQSAGGRFAGQATQVVQVNGSYSNTIVRESYTVTEKPKPAAVPVVVAAKSSSKSSSSASAPTAAVANPGSAQAYAAGAVAARGWGEDQYSCLVALWNKESGWRVNAENPSGAYGIPQALPGSKMASAGADWATNAGTQIEWGLGYITGRYGTPCGAWAHSVDSGWY